MACKGKESQGREFGWGTKTGQGPDSFLQREKKRALATIPKKKENEPQRERRGRWCEKEKKTSKKGTLNLPQTV